MHRKCDRKKLICGQCQRWSRDTCVYQENSLLSTEKIRPEPTILTEQPAVEEVEVEVLDLDSNDDKENKKSSKEEEYEVKAILERRRINPGGTQYLVKWKGYTDEENSWEPWKGLKSARRLTRKFEKGREKEREKEGEKESKKAKEREKEDEKSGIPLSTRSPFVLPLSTQPSRRIPKDVNCILGCRDSPLSNEYEYWVA